MQKLTIVITSLILYLAPVAKANDNAQNLLKDGKKGWFFYLDDYLDEPVTEALPVSPVQAQIDTPAETVADVVTTAVRGPAPLSTEWLKENLPRYLNLAIDNPTVENVTAYAYLQKYAINKASSFREAYQAAVFSDPYLDENNARPIATAAARLNDRLANEAQDEVLREMAKTAGIWFFYHSDCLYCVKQAPVIGMLQRKYGFNVTAVSLDGLPLPNDEFPDFKIDQGQAAKLNVTTTPTLMLVQPPNDYLVISKGIIAATEFSERAIILARQAGWIDEESFDETRKLRFAKAGGEDMTALEKLYGKDFEPKADDIVDYFKRQITSDI